MKRLGFEVVYLDEVMFTSNSNLKRTWAAKRSPISVDRKQMSHPTIACIASVSASNGLELIMQFPRSVDKHKFDEYLIKLRVKVGDRRVVLVLDNLSVHTCKYIQHRMAAHDFKWIFTIPYHPDANAIEFCFAQVKQSWKKLKLQTVIQQRKIKISQLIEQAFEIVTKRLV